MKFILKLYCLIFDLCPTCRKWCTYNGCSRSWREEPHCIGCRKPVDRCIC